jgi:preprotein translocase subunit SecE
VARQRQRARDRKGRGESDAPEGNGPAKENGPAQPGEIHRSNVPPNLEHSSFAEDEFEDAIVAGAEGVPLDEQAQAAFGDGAELVPADVAAANAIESEGPDHAKAGAPTRGGGNRVFNFLRASWAELQRVQWPDRRQVFQATCVVGGFVIIAGLYLGLADEVATKIVDYILNHSL